MKTTEPPVIRLKDYTAQAFLLDQVDLTFELDPDNTIVTSKLAVRRQDGNAEALHLDGDKDMTLLSVWMDGRELRDDEYDLQEDSLSLHDVPDRFTLEIQTAVNPAANTKLEGLYRSGGMYCTQCEAEGFRRITFFPDRPDVMARYRVKVCAPVDSCPVLLSNGNNVESGELREGWHYAIWDDPYPKPSYLFALVAGDLAMVEDHFKTKSGRDVTLRIFVEHGNETRCDHAMDSLKRSMKWDEDRFGLEYDLDIFNIVAVSDFNMGAMENKSLNIFNAKYILADAETATDSDFELVEGIVAHEYFHNWTGNRVTCRDWFQLSLKEGLTVFRDQEFSADQRSRAVKRIDDVRLLRARQFPEDSGPLSHPVRPDSYIEINNFYTATVYEKGAEVIRMMHALLGEDGFQKGMKLYFDRHDGQAVTCDDFVAAMADANDFDLSHFKRWYSQAGTPHVIVEEHYDAEAKRYTLTLSQETKPTPGQEKKLPLHIPLLTALLDSNGNDMAVSRQGRTATEHMLQLHSDKQEFVFDDVAEKPVLSINRDFTAPVVVQLPYDDTTRAFLMAHDSDAFNRWEAAQQYASTLMLKMVRQYQAGEDLTVDPDFVSAVGRVVQDQAIDASFKALLLTLPSEEYVSEQMSVVDIDAIHAARETLRQAIGDAHKDGFQHIYDAAKQSGPFSNTPEAAGQRALRNCALAYLGAADEKAAPTRLKNHFDAADNMTDSVAALRLLADVSAPARDRAFDLFLAKWRSNAQVMDKWLALQAMSRRADTLMQVRALLDHPVFNLKNPNKVRALVGAFCTGNPLRFHAADGSGYDFLAEMVIKLDKINPQVAARLLGPLGQWRRFDEDRQRKMRGALKSILDAPDLSRDVFEIASKSFGDS